MEVEGVKSRNEFKYILVYFGTSGICWVLRLITMKIYTSSNTFVDTTCTLIGVTGIICLCFALVSVMGLLLASCTRVILHVITCLWRKFGRRSLIQKSPGCSSGEFDSSHPSRSRLAAGFSCQELLGSVKEEEQKNNDAISDIVVRLRRDGKFLLVVKKIYSLVPEKLESLLNLLD